MVLLTVPELTVKAAVIKVFKGVVTSLAMEKIVIAPLQEIIQGIKPWLKETIKESINKNIDKEAVISAINIKEALIEAHGGCIWVANSMHREVIFTFTIPVNKVV